MLPRGKTILFADDDPDDLFLIGEAYKQAAIPNPKKTVADGEQVTAYLSGEGAYADRSAFPLPGFVVLDLKMPKKNGLEALEWIRARPEFDCVPVLMLSASNHPGDVTKAYQLGANAFLTKPTTAKQLAGLFVSVREFWLRFAEYPSSSEP